MERVGDRTGRATDIPSAIAAAGDDPRGARENQTGCDSNACAPELTYRDLTGFLDHDGWKCVDGKGLHTWFYLLPGKKGRSGTYGVDYLVSEAEVTQFVRGDKQVFARYEAYRRGAAARRASSGVDGDAGRGRGAINVNTDSSRALPGRGTTKGTGPTTAASSAGEEPGARCAVDPKPHSAPLQQQPARTSNRRGFDPAGGPPQAERPVAEEPPQDTAGSGQGSPTEAGASPSAGKGPRSTPTGRQAGEDTRKGSDRACGRRQVASTAGSQDEFYSEAMWRETWPKLREKGWHWVYGREGSIYLKEGVTKRTGTLGVDMFDSRKSLLDHIAQSSSAVRRPLPANEVPPAQDGEPEPEQLQEWNMVKHRAPRKRMQRTFPGDSPPPHTPPLEVEVMSLPGRGSGRTAGSSTGGREQVDGQSAGRGSRGPVAPLALESKRGRGRQPKRPRGDTAPNTSTKRGRVGGVKQPSGRGRGRAGVERTRELEDGNMSDDSREDMETAATQPQFELASAINMAAAGSRRAEGVSPAAGAATVVFQTASGAEVRGAAGGGSTSLPRSKEVAGEDVSGAQGSVSATESLQSRFTSGLPRHPPASSSSSGSGGGGGGGGGGEENKTPKRTVPASSPPKSSSSAQNGGGSKRKKRQGSPLAGNNGVRSSSRRINVGPFSDLAVIVTGLRGDPRKELLASITKLGGEEVVVFGKDCQADAWKRWLLDQARQRVAPDVKREAPRTNEEGSPVTGRAAATPGSLDSARPRRLIAVATPDSDRTPKFQLAMAAGVPIVHPSYVAACASIATAVKIDGYLLPLGRSALGDRGLVMPSRSARDRPFLGKTIMLCMDGSEGDRATLGNWLLTLTVAGATVKLLQEKSGERKGTGGGLGVVEARWYTVEAAIKLIEDGEIFCVIGPKITDGCSVLAATAAVEKAAERMGTPAGSLEWAIQCIAHGRLLLPNARTCPWFPLDAAGAERADSFARPDGTEKNGRGRGCGRRGSGRKGTAKRGGSTGKEAGSASFHVHMSGSKRYVAGDYVFLENKKGSVAKDGGRGDAAAAAATAATAGAATTAAAAGGDADGCLRVARVVSFRRDADGKVRVVVTAIRRGDGEKVLIAPGGEEGGDGDERDEVGEEMLGARVLALTKREMEATQLYSLNDSSVFCLAD